MNNEIRKNPQAIFAVLTKAFCLLSPRCKEFPSLFREKYTQSIPKHKAVGPNKCIVLATHPNFMILMPGLLHRGGGIQKLILQFNLLHFISRCCLFFYLLWIIKQAALNTCRHKINSSTSEQFESRHSCPLFSNKCSKCTSDQG